MFFYGFLNKIFKAVHHFPVYFDYSEDLILVGPHGIFCFLGVLFCFVFKLATLLLTLGMASLL